MSSAVERARAARLEAILARIDALPPLSEPVAEEDVAVSEVRATAESRAPVEPDLSSELPAPPEPDLSIELEAPGKADASGALEQALRTTVHPRAEVLDETPAAGYQDDEEDRARVRVSDLDPTLRLDDPEGEPTGGRRFVAAYAARRRRRGRTDH